MKTIYLLRASQGCYSDRSEWTVRAYASEDLANARAEAAEAVAAAEAAVRAGLERAKAQGLGPWWLGDISLPEEIGERACRADPNTASKDDDGAWRFSFLYDLPEYSVEAVDLVEEPAR